MDAFNQSVAEHARVIEVPLMAPADKSRWAFITEWQVEPQSDDRQPMFGRVAAGKSSQAAGRSRSRRQHQAMFKAWSQSRHD